MQRISKLSLLALAMLLPSFTKAQEQAEMADVMRSDGKIYVVVAVILIVLIGLFVYLFTIDRKVTKLEKKLGK